MSILENIRKTTLKKESAYSKVFIGELDDSSRVVVKLLKNANVHVYRTIAAANSHYFPEIYEISEEDDEEYSLTVIEEYIRGKTVTELLRERPFTQEDIFQLMEQLCKAVSLLHQMEPPLIHRDLKPQNLILTKGGMLKIIDFNAARFYKPDADSDTVHLGTVEYAPPEQFGFSQTDVRSDIYCIGVILYEVSRGKEFHQNTDRPSLASDGLDAVIGRCTMYDPAQRYQSVDELWTALEKCLRGGNRRRYRPLWIGGGVVTAAVVIAVLSFASKNMGVFPADGLTTEFSARSDATENNDESRIQNGEEGTEGSVSVGGSLSVTEDTVTILFPAKEDSCVYTFHLYDSGGEPVAVLDLRYNHTIPRLLKDRILLRSGEKIFSAAQSEFSLAVNEANTAEAVLTLKAQEIFGISANVMADFTWDMSFEQLPKLPSPTDIHWDPENPGTVIWSSSYPCIQINYQNNHPNGMNNSYNSPTPPTYTRSIIGVIQRESASYAVQVFALGDWTHGDSDPVMTDPFIYNAPEQRMDPVTEAWFQNGTVRWKGIDGATNYEVSLYGLDEAANEWEYMGRGRTATGTNVNISDWIELMEEKNQKLGVTVRTLSPDIYDCAAAEPSEIFEYE